MKSHSKYNAGASMVEFIVMMPVLIFVVLGTVQMGLMYRTKATFNQATFAAAREGALNHAFVRPMRTILANGLAPLYLRDDPSLANYTVALVQSRLENSILLENLGGVRIDIVSPTRAIFNQFSVDHRPLISCNRNCPGGGRRQLGRDNDIVRQIPNDNLSIRAASAQSIGSSQRINLQDANLLKIRAHMCYELEVPFVGRIIFRILTLLGGRGEHWAACAARTAATDNNTFFIPIMSSSVVRMQTPVRCEGDLRRGRNCSNLR